MKKESPAANRFIPIIVIAALLIMLVILIKYSVDKSDADSYIVASVPSADFTMEIDQEGDVHVTEKWKVSFSDEEDSDRFYRSFEMGETAPEKVFSIDLSSIRVSIDGKPCEDKSSVNPYMLDTRALENAYTINKINYSGDDYYMYCYKSSRNVTRDIVISYTLHDAVMRVDNSYNLFLDSLPLYHYRIKQLSFKIITPEGSRPIITNGKIFGLYKEVKVKDNTALLMGREDLPEVFKLKVRIDDADIKGAVPVNSDDLSEADDNPLPLGVIFELIWMMLGLIAIISMIVIRKINKRNINFDYLPHGLRQKDLLKLPALTGVRQWFNYSGVIQIFAGLFLMMANEIITDQLWEYGYYLPEYIINLLFACVVLSGIILIVRKTSSAALITGLISCFSPILIVVVSVPMFICAIVLGKVWLEYRMVKGKKYDDDSQ